MIPMYAVIEVSHPRGAFRLWAPLFLLWLVLAPVALILAPVALVACAIKGISPWRAAAAIAALLCALSGTHVQVDSPGAQVLVRIQ